MNVAVIRLPVRLPMEFVLHYAGDLKSGQSKKISQHKHNLRKHFHKQLLLLTERDPVAQWDIITELPCNSPNREGKYFFQRDSFTFLPLVNKKLGGYAEISVKMLRPEKPGNLLSETADIDNRLKTLFDALQVPDDNQLPSSASPDVEEQPYFICLLEDDRLVTRVEVQAFRLLDPLKQGKNYVDLQIHVKTWATDSTRRSAYLK